jgi:hypothetical protein
MEAIECGITYKERGCSKICVPYEEIKALYGNNISPDIPYKERNVIFRSL